MSIRIERGTARDAYEIYRAIPEFAPHTTIDFAQFEHRLSSDSALILIARDDAADVAFKAGYDRYRDGSWYSWLGGVVPAYRGRDVARGLLEYQENWVRSAGYTRIYVKTRNRFAAMRALLAMSGYQIVALDAPDVTTPIAELRLTLVKVL